MPLQTEVHRVVEDADRYDTSTADTNLLVTQLDSGEIRVEGQYEGELFEATLPDPGSRFLIVFGVETRSWSTVSLEDLPATARLAYHILRPASPEPSPAQ